MDNVHAKFYWTITKIDRAISISIPRCKERCRHLKTGKCGSLHPHHYLNGVDLHVAKIIGLKRVVWKLRTIPNRWSEGRFSVVRTAGGHHNFNLEWLGPKACTIVHSKKTDPWGVFDFFQIFWKIFQFSLFQCLEAAFVLLTFQFQVCSILGKQFSVFRAKISGLPFRPQASVPWRCASYIYQTYQRRAKASRRWLCTTTALVRCREDGRNKSEMCWHKRKFLIFFSLVKADVLFFFFLDALLLCLFGGERQDSVLRPFLASSPLSVAKVDVSEISNRLPDYFTLKNNSHEAWKCSVTRKKYVERPHTAVFRRQRLGTTPSIPWQDDSFGAKHRRLLLWSVREHHIRVVQWSAFVSTDKLWLSRLSFLGTDYSDTLVPSPTALDTRTLDRLWRGSADWTSRRRVRSTRRWGNHMHDDSRFLCDFDDVTGVSFSFSLSLSLYYCYSQKSLTYNIGSASALPIINEPRSLKMLSNKKEVLWAATHSGVQTTAAGNNTQYTMTGW